MSGKALRYVIIGIAALSAVGYGAFKMRAGAAKKDDFGRLVAAHRGDILIKVSETGTLEPVVKVDVKSRVGGRLQKIFVRAGDRIRAGDPIALIDATEVARQVAGVQSQLEASQAGLHQAEENRNLVVAQNLLSIRRAEVGVLTAQAQLKDAQVSLKDAQVGLESAKLGVTTAQKRLAQTSAPTRTQEIDQAEAQVRRIEAQKADAQRLLDRRRSLLAKGFLAQQDVDSAETQLRLAETDLDSARRRVDLLKEGPRQEDIEPIRLGVDAARNQVDQAKVRVEQAKVRVEQARIGVRTSQVELATQRANTAQGDLRARDIERSRADVAQVRNQLAQQSVQLTETRIVAPMGGEITGKYIEEGELVASATAGFAQGAALVTIADLTRMQVRVNINEVDVTRLSRDLPVEIRVDGIPDKVYKGRVAAIAPASLTSSQPGQGSQSSGAGASGNSVVRFEVKVTVVNGDKRLRPGMSASVDLILNRKKDTLVLPAEALRTPGNKVVVVTGVGEKRTRTDRSVTIGLKNEALAEIREGLKEGDLVEVQKVDAKDRRKVDFQAD